jgi:hypothetical protein
MATLPNLPCCRHASNRECHGYMTLKRTTPAVSGSPWSYICREVPPFPFPPPGRSSAPADVNPFLLPKDALSPPCDLSPPCVPAVRSCETDEAKRYRRRLQSARRVAHPHWDSRDVAF